MAIIRWFLPRLGRKIAANHQRHYTYAGDEKEFVGFIVREGMFRQSQNQFEGFFM